MESGKLISLDYKRAVRPRRKNISETAPLPEMQKISELLRELRAAGETRNVEKVQILVASLTAAQRDCEDAIRLDPSEPHNILFKLLKERASAVQDEIIVKIINMLISEAEEFLYQNPATFHAAENHLKEIDNFRKLVPDKNFLILHRIATICLKQTQKLIIHAGGEDWLTVKKFLNLTTKYKDGLDKIQFVQMQMLWRCFEVYGDEDRLGENVLRLPRVPRQATLKAVS